MRKKSHYSEDKRALNRTNRALSMQEVLAALPDDIKEHTKIVGAWLWTTYQEKPDPETLDYLYCLGFIFNPRRGAWQHPCSTKTHGRARGYDHRQKYGEQEVKPDHQTTITQ